MARMSSFLENGEHDDVLYPDSDIDDAVDLAPTNAEVPLS